MNGSIFDGIQALHALAAQQRMRGQARAEADIGHT